MYPTSYNDFKEILTPATILRRFPSVSFEDLFSANKGISMSEGPKDITIEVDMPGLEAKDIQVNLENGLLQIRGEKKEEVGDEDRRFYSKSSRKFATTINIPVNVDETKVEATYDKGVMHITIPKTEQTPSKLITVHEKGSTTSVKNEKTTSSTDAVSKQNKSTKSS